MLVLMGVLAFVSSSCDDDDDDDNTPNLVQFNNLALTGNAEDPPNNSTATGTFNGTYNEDTNILTYTITFSGLTPTAMHFHKGAIGVSGGVEVPIGSMPYTSPVTGQTPALTAAQETDLMAGLWYVNVHSSQFPGGEIRAQLVK